MRKWYRKELAIDLLRNRKIDPVSGCWLWQGFKSRQGYGYIRIGLVKVRVHRVSAWVFNLWTEARKREIGPGAKGFLVLHKCDNPPCFRPDHLLKGDAAKNAEDAIRKGRRQGPWMNKTKCRNGHPWNDIYILPKKHSRFGRATCRQCRREAERKRNRNV